MEKRVFLIVLDSFGIGAEPDAAAFGDAFAAARVEDFGALALGGGHRADDRLGLLEDVVRNLDAFERLAHAGDHRSEVFEVAHLLDLLYLT